jgi:NAD(P)-dependent dehydrogenase (short-subunit alcohol dehydrogenase family)
MIQSRRNRARLPRNFDALLNAKVSAFLSLCDALRRSVSPRGVTATALSPGYVDTDLSAWKQGDIQPNAMLRTPDIAELALAITSSPHTPSFPTSRYRLQKNRSGEHECRAEMVYERRDCTWVLVLRLRG